MKTKTPTLQVYEELQQAYDHFNEGLFAAELPACLITLQRMNHLVGEDREGVFDIFDRKVGRVHGDFVCALSLGKIAKRSFLDSGQTR
jgi:hypothetical protein